MIPNFVKISKQILKDLELFNFTIGIHFNIRDQIEYLQYFIKLAYSIMLPISINI